MRLACQCATSVIASIRVMVSCGHVACIRVAGGMAFSICFLAHWTDCLCPFHVVVFRWSKKTSPALHARMVWVLVYICALPWQNASRSTASCRLIWQCNSCCCLRRHRLACLGTIANGIFRFFLFKRHASFDPNMFLGAKRGNDACAI